jgi:hypothetical protein
LAERLDPAADGQRFSLPFSLEPLADLRDDLLILSGLDKAHSRQGDGHYAKTANFLTGMPVEKTTGKNINSGGISLDQLVAQHVGSQTPLPSLELGTEPVISGVDSNVGYTRLYGSHISWQSPTRPVAKEINPRLVYERLFGADGQAPALDGEHQHLLDFVLEDARRLRGRLGRDDQFKFDEYLDAVRAVERRIEFHQHRGAEDWNPQDERAAGEPRAGTSRRFPRTCPLDARPDRPGLPHRCDARQHLDVRQRRVRTQLCVRRRGLREPSRAVASREQTRTDRPVRADRAVARRAVRRDAAADEVDPRGRRHAAGQLDDPVRLRHVRRQSPRPEQSADHRRRTRRRNHRHRAALASPKNTPLCNLHLALAHRMGLDIQAFGDSTGELKDLGTES